MAQRFLGGRVVVCRFCLVIILLRIPCPSDLTTFIRLKFNLVALTLGYRIFGTDLCTKWTDRSISISLVSCSKLSDSVPTFWSSQRLRIGTSEAKAL